MKYLRKCAVLIALFSLKVTANHLQIDDGANNVSQEHKQRTNYLVEQIEAKLTKVKKDSYGSQIITLETGQVWDQTDGSKFKLANGHQIVITHGALSSYFLSKENANRKIRIKRVK